MYHIYIIVYRYIPVHTGTYRYVPKPLISYHWSGFQMADAVLRYREPWRYWNSTLKNLFRHHDWIQYDWILKHQKWKIANNWYMWRTRYRKIFKIEDFFLDIWSIRYWRIFNKGIQNIYTYIEDLSFNIEGCSISSNTFNIEAWHNIFIWFWYGLIATSNPAGAFTFDIDSVSAIVPALTVGSTLEHLSVPKSAFQLPKI